MTTEASPFSLRWILSQAIDSIRQPRDVAGRMLNLGLPLQVLWQVLVLVVAVSVLLGQGTLLLGGADAAAAPMVFSPLTLGVLQLALLALMVGAIDVIGRAMGGAGTFTGALVLVTWLQVVMVCLQLLQTAAFLLMPPLAVVLGYVGLVLFIWLLTNFIAVLHGFQSLGLVFVMILMSAFGIAFVLSLVLAITGIMPPGGFNV